MKQRYDVILFDADRTLFDFDQPQRLALGEVYRANGIPETEENIQTYVRLNDQLWARFDKGKISLEELEYIRFRDFAEALGLTNLNANQLNQQYIQALGRNSILLPGAEALCAALAPYCTQYIVTNGIKEAQEGRLERSPIRQYIKKMYMKTSNAGFFCVCSSACFKGSFTPECSGGTDRIKCRSVRTQK